MIAVVDRIVQYANRYKLTDVSTGTVLGIFDFEAETGTIQQVGTEINKELFDSIASDIAAKLTASGGDSKNCIVAFNEASTLANINSGESHSTIFGKIKKWFTDRISGLKAFAYNANIKIAKTDLDSSVQTSLGKADTALQTHQDISGKVDKVAGKGLSTEDYTTTEKTKLAGIASGAEVNVQSDWSQSDNTKDDYIKNKPTKLTDFTNDGNFVQDANYVHTDSNYTAGEKTKVANLPTDTVRYGSQSLTDAQKAQARSNIGAGNVTTDTKQTISGGKTFTGGISVSGRPVGSGDDEGIVVGVAANNYAGVCCGSPSGRRAVFYLKPSASSGNSIWRYNSGSASYDIAHPEKSGTIALTSDIPTESTVSGWGFTKNAGTITGVQLNGKTVASNGVANVQALPNFSLNISHQTAGNPRPVKFLTVDYNTAATYFKMSATSCHDNGNSYQFLEDIIIGCTTSGTVVCNVYKYCQQAVTYDGATRNYGDVFYVIDTTNKKVDFFILCGQWASSQFTPATKIGNTTIAYITQHTGTATYYSSGTKVWASGDSTTYARLSDIPDTSGLMPKSGGTFTGSVSAPSFYATSDRRLKENIKPAELDCGKVIDDLQIKEFNFKSDEEKKVVVGAIAQELQEILPEKYRATLVSGSEDTHYSINEGKLLFIAIGALKEERAKTKELEERLAKLEKMLGV